LLGNFSSRLELLYLLQRAQKIIIHGLWNEKLIRFFLCQPWLFKKMYLVPWGGDFYFPEKQSLAKRLLLGRIGNFVTYLKGDYEYIKEHYKATGRYHDCIMYPSNIYWETNPCRKAEASTLNILVGNSAQETNRHLLVLEKLKNYRDRKIRLFCPLSYGDNDYARKVMDTGQSIFGKKFIPLRKFLPFQNYLKFLRTIDIGFFLHNRQQGMGNVIQLLGNGRKVFLSRGTSQYEFFRQCGITVFDIENCQADDLLVPFFKDNENNRIIVKRVFSESRLASQWKDIFDA